MKRAGDWFGLLFVVSVVYVLFRPNSGAAQLIEAVGRAGVAVVRRATDMSN